MCVGFTKDGQQCKATIGLDNNLLCFRHRQATEGSLTSPAKKEKKAATSAAANKFIIVVSRGEQEFAVGPFKTRKAAEEVAENYKQLQFESVCILEMVKPSVGEEVPVVEERDTCAHFFSRGKNKGQTCSNYAIKGSAYCRSHTKVVPSEDNSEEDNEDREGKCSHKFTRGANKGRACKKACVEGTPFCKQHAKSASSEEEEKTEVQAEAGDRNTCEVVLLRGKNKGNVCGKPAMSGTLECKAHQGKMAEKKSAVCEKEDEASCGEKEAAVEEEEKQLDDFAKLLEDDLFFAIEEKMGETPAVEENKKEETPAVEENKKEETSAVEENKKEETPEVEENKKEETKSKKKARTSYDLRKGVKGRVYLSEEKEFVHIKIGVHFDENMPSSFKQTVGTCEVFLARKRGEDVFMMRSVEADKALELEDVFSALKHVFNHAGVEMEWVESIKFKTEKAIISVEISGDADDDDE
jgi:hypothetical protein